MNGRPTARLQRSAGSHPQREPCPRDEVESRAATGHPSNSDETARKFGRERSAAAAVLRVLVSCFCLLVAPVGRAAADPITTVIITSGELVGDSLGARAVLVGADFRVTGSGDVVGGFWGPAVACVPCPPGSALNLGAHWSGGDFQGIVAVGGQSYPMGSGESGTASVDAVWVASAVAPNFTGALNASIVTPFTFSGTFLYPLSDPRPRVSLLGAGTATINLDWHSDGFWLLDHARYEFQSADPVPEPGTLLLIGAGAVSALARHRRRLSRQMQSR
jgi:hypothetical protein